MGSSKQQDRSLGAGISIPQWMKGRVDNRYDFDETAFSPPSHDDSFFYVRYPKPQQNLLKNTEENRPLGKVISESNIGATTTRVETRPNTGTTFKEVKDIDFSKHPLPCQPFVPTGGNKANEVKSPKVITAGNVKPKSQGTDDGFHGEPALCGKSIVRVANQMMSNKFRQMPAEQHGESSRKGSRSLPATPLASPIASPDSSPKARRRTPSNRYFTAPFVPDREKYQGGWILASILGQSREIVNSKIEEEDETMDVAPSAKSLSRKKSISSQNLTYIGKEEKPSSSSSSSSSAAAAAAAAAAYAAVLQPKPSELREMNFWSPTSM